MPEVRIRNDCVATSGAALGVAAFAVRSLSISHPLAPMWCPSGPRVATLAAHSKSGKPVLAAAATRARVAVILAAHRASVRPVPHTSSTACISTDRWHMRRAVARPMSKRTGIRDGSTLQLARSSDTHGGARASSALPPSPSHVFAKSNCRASMPQLLARA